jgi:hypothetical protein
VEATHEQKRKMLCLCAVAGHGVLCKHIQICAIDKATIIRGKENNRLSDFVWCTHPPKSGGMSQAMSKTGCAYAPKASTSKLIYGRKNS